MNAPLNAQYILCIYGGRVFSEHCSLRTFPHILHDGLPNRCNCTLNARDIDEANMTHVLLLWNTKEQWLSPSSIQLRVECHSCFACRQLKFQDLFSNFKKSFLLRRQVLGCSMQCSTKRFPKAREISWGRKGCTYKYTTHWQNIPHYQFSHP